MFGLLLLLLVAYILGSIPFGKIIGQRSGIDIQKHGSGNIGFANCLRVLGWKPASIVLIGDILKGFIPVYFALQIFPFELAMYVALAAIVGHVFPIWLKFNGGKGIATGLGALFALHMPLAIACMTIWVILFAVTRLNALASVLMILSLPILAMVVAIPMVSFSAALLTIGTWTHRKNIESLLNRSEKKLL